MQFLAILKADLLAVVTQSGIDLREAIACEAADLERLGDRAAAEYLRKSFKENK